MTNAILAIFRKPEAVTPASATIAPPRHQRSLRCLALALVAAGLVAGTAEVVAQSRIDSRISDVRGTKHNFSNISTYEYKDPVTKTVTTLNAPSRTVVSPAVTGSNEVCVFCHTPHAGKPNTPLWNKQLSTAQYTPYTSKSLDSANIIGESTDPATIGQVAAMQPAGTSKLCLSCHDGTLAVGSVEVYAKTQRNVPILNTDGGTLPDRTPSTSGASATTNTGFTRRLGVDLRNDHPISVTYGDDLATRDTELRVPSTMPTLVGPRTIGANKPLLPLENTGVNVAGFTVQGGGTAGGQTAGSNQIQCGTCHDPHVRERPTSGKAIEQYDATNNLNPSKFLRGNRFQNANPANSFEAGGARFDKDNDIICLTCHDKNINAQGTWAYSAHANPNVANEIYTNTGTGNANPVVVRDFPGTNTGTDSMRLRVWQASCLNCHDPHTVPGARRLTREGVVTSLTGSGVYPKRNSAANPYSNSATDSSAIEETCYQCHNGGVNTVLTAPTVAGLIKGTTNTATANESSVTNRAPDVGADFSGTNKRMPIAKLPEIHDIGLNSFDLANSALSTNTNVDCIIVTGSPYGCGTDFVESPQNLKAVGGGAASEPSRHVECTDCHNPHRVVKNHCFNGDWFNATTGASYDGCKANATLAANDTIKIPNDRGTHFHIDSNGFVHSNVISGVLRGAWGVEPVYPTNILSFDPDGAGPTAAVSYPANSFHRKPSSYKVLRGDPTNGSNGQPLATFDPTLGGAANTTLQDDYGNLTPITPANKDSFPYGYVTREYQICLKCHSDWGWGGGVVDGATSPWKGNAVGEIGAPTLASNGVGTLSGTNSLTYFTNQAREFRAPRTHMGEPTGMAVDGGARNYPSAATDSNHRSWHPVMRPTGRDSTARGTTPTFRAPWSNTGALGSQTMYCSDCHGSAVADAATSVIPTTGKPWGPHGSTNNFLLKGLWTFDSVDATTTLCLKCHDPTSTSGFNGGGRGNLHAYHKTKIGSIQCTWCHVAVPHGWKNKSFLVNLNDVGEEAGHPHGASYEVAISGVNDNYTAEPYYLEAKNKIRTFQRGGQWADSSCGSAGKTTAGGLTTKLIPNSQGGTANATGNGVSWMTDNICNGTPP